MKTIKLVRVVGWKVKLPLEMTTVIVDSPTSAHSEDGEPYESDGVTWSDRLSAEYLEALDE